MPEPKAGLEGLGFRVLGLGFRVLGLGFWVYGLGFSGLVEYGSLFFVKPLLSFSGSLGFRVWDEGFRLFFRVFGVWGFQGFRDLGLGV